MESGVYKYHVEVVERVMWYQQLNDKVFPLFLDKVFTIFALKLRKSSAAPMYPVSITAHIILGQIDFNQPRGNGDFRSGYSTTDHIHVINQLMEQSIKYERSLFMAFKDYEKAFDSIKTLSVMNTLLKEGIHESYVRKLEDIYT
ncbi:uncharacterized protein [Palaemon carinicauda]|uniref:uncharacterized protein n=1 Tax=Palaemon carinicauda TaxID=392227 RepID=UPI0035B5C96C